ncbi:antitoxin MazE family protein [Mycolicibacterium cosmeticum]|uniref:antitoxin MazE family protein n=1 Tax=Mycolicibacterium cosmeticum TaxID=258533 RepID=UPI003204C5C1
MPIESADDDLEALASSRLGEKGLRPIQIWVPDTRAPEFAEEAHRQAALVAAADDAAEDQAWVDDISQFNDDNFGG